ncbi:methyltransferase family protein [Haloferax sp. DFSO60]|uniref:methyltransferase family protein n=1 Tax=Haloferax sp. DFSO60 TaxID=3388652 RepID=UPI00397A1E80
MARSTLLLVAFGTGLVAATGVYLLLVGTLLTPRQWWPPGDKSWAYYLHWSLVGLAGFGLFVNSGFVAILAAAHIGWVLLLPFAEEPHLRDEYGPAYEQYAARVPRFVDRTTIRNLVG